MMTLEERMDFLRIFPDEAEPEILERQTWILNEMLAMHPALSRKVLGPVRVEGRKEEAQRSVCRLLTLRGLALTPEQEARIEAQGMLEVLHCWFDQAFTACTVEEALG